MNTSRSSGFTLVELMIVTAIVSVVAGVAVPNLLSSRSVANERVVLAALRTVSTAQVQCQSRGLVDIDGDGRGEALGLAEMAGSRTLRGSTEALSPPVLPQSLGVANAAGHTLSRGYLMAVYLPDAAGVGLATTPANDASIAPDLAEMAWTCIAWPLTRGRTGRSTFFVNQTGEILEAKLAAYNGTTTVPPAGAALLGATPDVIAGLPIAADTVGADGNRWTLIR